VASPAGHVAARDWRVHGGPGAGRGAPVHGGLGWGRARGAGGLANRGGTGRVGGGAMADAGEVAASTLRGTARRSEGTGGMSEAWRVQCARCLCERGARVRWPRGGGGSAATSSSGDAVRAKGRDREGGRSSGGFLTSTRSSGIGFRHPGCGN